MIPKTFSATSLQVAELCLSRYHAEFILFGRGIQSSAANVGIVCHGTFEEFIRSVFILKTNTWDEDFFWKIFHDEYNKVFGPDQTIPEYDDAKTLCHNWFHRDNQLVNLKACKILSLESKNNFMIKTTAGEIPVNYIMDRLEQTGDTEFRVVDYKSNRVALNPTQMRKKIQPELYALAVQIKFPKATSIWVEFDYLRHQPVGIEFKREDNVATFRKLQRATQRIIDTPETSISETLNSECTWCVRKSDCKTLQKHISVGGILGKSLDELSQIYQTVADQRSAQDTLLAEIEKQLLDYAIENDTLQYETDHATVTVTASRRRTPNREAIAAILGPDLAVEVGSFRVADMDKLITQGRVTPGQAMLLKAAMPQTIGDPTIKIEPKDPF